MKFKYDDHGVLKRWLKKRYMIQIEFLPFLSIQEILNLSQLSVKFNQIIDSNKNNENKKQGSVRSNHLERIICQHHQISLVDLEKYKYGLSKISGQIQIQSMFMKELQCFEKNVGQLKKMVHKMNQICWAFPQLNQNDIYAIEYKADKGYYHQAK